MTQTAGNLLIEELETDSLEVISRTYLQGFAPNRVRAILAEAQRLRGRLSSIPWYQRQAQKQGQELWLRLAISYAGEDQMGNDGGGGQPFNAHILKEQSLIAPYTASRRSEHESIDQIPHSESAPGHRVIDGA